MEVRYVLGTFHEIILKGHNRGFFERTLVANLRRALEGLPLASVTIPSRVVMAFHHEVPWPQIQARLATVFGLAGLIPAARAGESYEALEQFVSAHLDWVVGESFAVRCKRSNKRFPLTSEDIQRRLGAFIRHQTGKRVDLTNPATTVRVYVQTDGIYVSFNEYRGAGGLPVGTSGKALVLLSGGIDSPVAALLTLKRGAKVGLVHFHSAPFTSEASIRKVVELARILARYQGQLRLTLVPFGEFQQEVARLTPERLRVVLYRRMMLRVAERIARKSRFLALVTGESLNQVSSQTLENLAAIDRVAHMPVLRPLVGMDKQEIIDLAVRAGTFDLSILPHQDCCSFLQPLHPATRTTAKACEAAEQPLEVDRWARYLQRQATHQLIQPLPWEN
ncbi:MAG: tRNA 4-thiouridine(8) synthase ThiI [Thermoanaerobaculum sp.]|nr:tRNA 4-thiouridine(8) synthase ThiI [Thermoanaerobaculum sp.]MDW7968265.1 tRNA uracil 4-sulfurtransferase ThiI [Thermoanaerobaculum sp.]